MQIITLKQGTKMRHTGKAGSQGVKVRVTQRFKVRVTLTRNRQTYHHG